MGPNYKPPTTAKDPKVTTQSGGNPTKADFILAKPTFLNYAGQGQIRRGLQRAEAKFNFGKGNALESRALINNMRNNQRNLAIQQSDTARQKQITEADDALQRRFAAQGGLNSGAFLKFQQQTRDQINQQSQSQLNDVLAQQGAQYDQMAVAQNEAEAGRDIQKETARVDLEFKNRLMNMEQGTKLKELDLADKQMRIDSTTTDFNKRVAEAEAGRNSKFLGIF